MTILDKMIQDCVEKGFDENSEMVGILRDLQNEVPEDASIDEIIQVVESKIKAITLAEAEIDEDDSYLTEDKMSDEEEQEIKAKVIETVKSCLNKKDFRYGVDDIRHDITKIHYSVLARGIPIKMNIYVEANPLVCRISAKLPVCANNKLRLIISKLLCDLNHSFRFGGFRLGKDDGEISYEYSTSIQNGIHENDLELYIDVAICTAIRFYETLSKACVGKFNDSELNKLTSMINELVDELNS